MESRISSLTDMIEKVISLEVTRMLRRQESPRVDEAGFLLGQRLEYSGMNGKVPIFLANEDRRKHIYVVGATGSGKSNVLVRLIEHEIKYGGTALVIDLRGDLVDRLLTRFTGKEELIDKIRLVDLRQDEFYLPFNPLAGTGDRSSRALHLQSIIRKESDSWGIQLDETLRYCLLALCEAGGTLLDIERLLSERQFRSTVLSRCSDQYVRSFFYRYDALSAERQQSWSLPVLNKISAFWTVPGIRRMLAAKEGIDWNSWLGCPGCLVLIALAVHRFHSASHLVGSLLISSLQNAVMSRADLPEQDRNQVSLYIDEFETMATSAFNAVIAEGRRFGLSLLLAHQNLSQLDQSLRQTIRANVHTQLIFQCASPDASELANDVLSDEPKESVRRSLLAQQVGQAFLVRRGQSSMQVATIHSPDPQVPREVVRSVKHRLLQATCLPSDSVPVPRLTLEMEVQHVRRPRFDC